MKHRVTERTAAVTTSETTAPEIPVVDLTDFRAGGRRAAADAICAALEAIGFFAIRGHGVDQALIDRTFAAAHDFFVLSEAEKRSITINHGHRGYMPMADQHRAEANQPNLSESFIVGTEIAADDPDVLAQKPMHSVNQWPEGMPGLRGTMLTYHAALTDLGRSMLPLFETALDLPDGYFASVYKTPMAFIRALHYPPAPDDMPADQFGAAAHSDFGFITILAQDDVGGLQVQAPNGDWIDAPNIPGAFVVNIGDMLMRWTNDRFRSTVHRVINAPGRDRYSLPFFFDPQFDTVVACLDSCKSDDRPARYPPISWGDHLTERFDANHVYRKRKAG